MTIEVLYSCHPCGLLDVRVPVRERGANEDIADWMHHLSHVLGHDHASRSPKCRPKTLSNVKIPMPDGATRIGGLPEH